MLASAGFQTVTKPLSWGRVVPYVGVAVAAGGLIYSALEWFYGQAQQASGTDLDGWYGGTPGLAEAFVATISAANEGYAGANVRASYRLGGSGQVVELFGFRSEPYISRPFSASLWGEVFMGAAGAWRDAYPSGDRWSSDVSADAWVVSTVHLLPGAHETREYRVVIREPLADLLARSQPARRAARDIVRDYLANQDEQGSWPYTYEAPYGPATGIGLEPAPNINQWYDNPYANPALDTDGDGWPDWKEVLGGTDPLDPNDYPAYDPAPGEDPNENPLPDRDGDGIPDIYDPCPAQASNKCSDAAEPEDPIEIPDDYMRDATGQAQLNALNEILEELRRDEQDDTPAGQPDAPMPELSPLSEPSLTWTVFEDVASQMESAATSWWADAQTRLPFALGVAWVPAAPSVGAGDCQGVQMTILGQSQEVGLCGTAIDSFLAGPGRAVLLAALLVGFYLASAQVVTRL